MDTGQNDLERVKADLEVMKNAAGMGRTYTWKDVRVGVIMGFVCLFPAGLDIFVLNITNKYLSLFIICVAMFLVVVTENIGKQEETSRSRPKRSYFWVMFIITWIFLMGYGIWEDEFKLPKNLWLGVWFMFLGAVSGVESYWRNRKPYDVIFSISLMIFGMLLPFYSSKMLTVFGLPNALGAFVYAGVIAYVIFRQKVSDDTH